MRFPALLEKTGSFQQTMITQGWPNLFLRLVTGFGFAAHGWAKLSRGPDGFGDILGQLALPFPHVTAWATTLIELLGGISLMLGTFVIPASLPLAATMLTAMLSVHLQYGFSTIKLKAILPSGAVFGPPGYELNLLYLAALLALALGGPGRFSLEAWLRAKFQARV